MYRIETIDYKAKGGVFYESTLDDARDHLTSIERTERLWARNENREPIQVIVSAQAYIQTQRETAIARGVDEHNQGNTR